MKRFLTAFAPALGAGLTIGVVAFLVDVTSGWVSRGIGSLTGKGFLWGVTAFVVAYLGSTRRNAILASILSLTTATAFYYALILIGTDRWRSARTYDGEIAVWPGLMSVGRAFTSWSLAAVAAGFLLGYLAHLTKASTPNVSSLAAGSGAGLLASGGLHALVVPRWDPFERVPWIPPALTILSVILAFGVSSAMLMARHAPRWSQFAVASIVAAVLGHWSLDSRYGGTALLFVNWRWPRRRSGEVELAPPPARGKRLRPTRVVDRALASRNRRPRRPIHRPLRRRYI